MFMSKFRKMLFLASFGPYVKCSKNRICQKFFDICLELCLLKRFRRADLGETVSGKNGMLQLKRGKLIILHFFYFL